MLLEGSFVAELINISLSLWCLHDPVSQTAAYKARKSMPTNGMGSATACTLNAVNLLEAFHICYPNWLNSFSLNVIIRTVLWPLVPQMLDVLIMMLVVVLMVIWVCIEHTEQLCQDILQYLHLITNAWKVNYKILQNFSPLGEVKQLQRESHMRTWMNEDSRERIKRKQTQTGNESEGSDLGGRTFKNTTFHKAFQQKSHSALVGICYTSCVLVKFCGIRK